MGEITKAMEALAKVGLTENHIEAYLKQKNVNNVEENVKRFELVTDEMTKLFARKNKDYGNSFEISLDEDGLLVAKIRLQDKLQRFAQLINNQAEVKDESIRDTIIDLANYAAMTVMWMDAQAELEQVRKMVTITDDKERAIGGDNVGTMLRPKYKPIVINTDGLEPLMSTKNLTGGSILE